MLSWPLNHIDMDCDNQGMTGLCSAASRSLVQDPGHTIVSIHQGDSHGPVGDSELCDMAEKVQAQVCVKRRARCREGLDVLALGQFSPWG